ncbi:hypothetical protein [Tepidimonas charontis]|uniref:hypothetical protein n=1 Tax=Tepidimonas charontis TaxID=2267262 RepID=UPI001F380331|nr:hypothetical protein [Tepidimonas charontis]
MGLRAHGAVYGVATAFILLCALCAAVLTAAQLAAGEHLPLQRCLELAGAGVGVLLAAPAAFAVRWSERRRAARADAQRAEALRTAADDITKRDGAVLLPRAILFAVAQQQQQLLSQLLSLRSRSAFSRAAAVAALAFARARMHAAFVALPRAHTRAFAFRPGC